MKNSLWILLVSLFVACQAEHNVLNNAVYFVDAQNNTGKKIAIDNTGVRTKITSRVARSLSSDVKVYYHINENALEAYNIKNGTDYKLLPTSFYTFSAEAIIKAGEINSTPIELSVKAYDETLSSSDKYAIPIGVASVEGEVPILETSANLIILLDQIIVTAVPFFGSGIGGLTYTPETTIDGLNAWTLEANINLTKYNRNNVAIWNVFGADGKTAIYTRFGDVTCEQNQFQAKIGANKPQSVTRFTALKWYHIALTYDGANIRFYVDGKLDFISPHDKPGEVFRFKDILFANGTPLNGYANEVRYWSVCRSQSEVVNNMYIVSPKSEGLIVYWKCNEGSGTLINDHSSNQFHSNFKKEPDWMSEQRFPDNDE